MRSDSPAHNQTIETVDHGREIDLSNRYLELSDVGKQFLLWGLARKSRLMMFSGARLILPR